ncbi:MAG: hypothetical protein A3C30_01545 [Candidatus Levybacteria bacterium RIFCSPHIGHO2_02_FULL_40_18]|nr:MAG: hypothetical protein A2869_01110 [Candidatus Levybacteria bacterium RIFCSPHIGHO2_01_FULL_40_58]OGH26677.1 MAG: hypothetical protein A3C30_01545 [Candidatus Levybacteria bacterium RIFCSPHIGHO2_02_FULL_40_18]OGH31612.1 MAG: hypothetical protein A3E43_01265 [Candidatus Levybacteria bacterium RIFCSPHIGHO2_12_FULL_40_31]OGH40240.1 MAG: hypothetical protein A2894_02280 [Candidatus Levybacteria bacterium RIFCSPLOWO2_01_FULL_40_64]OGH49480.1 MAG: hypothetical protein A3I54_05330 [Candidatus Lev
MITEALQSNGRNHLKGAEIIPSAWQKPDADAIIRNTKPYKRPEVWSRSVEADRLTIRDKVEELVLELAFGATPAFRKLTDLGYGRESHGEVEGREGEDEELEIDTKAEARAEEIVERVADRFGLSLFVFSEHNSFGVGDRRPDVVAFLDPIDNSGEYEDGHNTPPYIAISFFDKRGVSLAGLVSNLMTGHIFINKRGKNYEYNPNIRNVERRLRILPKPRKIVSIHDRRFSLSSYDGKYKYTAPFRTNFDLLDRDRNQNNIFHGKAGAHSGEAISTGSMGMYIAPFEPLAESLTLIPFAKAAGYICAEVSLEDGSWKEFELSEDLIKMFLSYPHTYNNARTPLLIVAKSRELIYQAIRYGFSKPLLLHESHRENEPGFQKISPRNVGKDWSTYEAIWERDKESNKTSSLVEGDRNRSSSNSEQVLLPGLEATLRAGDLQKTRHPKSFLRVVETGK